MMYHSDQLDKLAGGHFFGSGSRIIITSKDRFLLSKHKVDRIYRPKKLSYEEALDLFSLKSFEMKHPPKGYMELSNHFLNYAAGHPLAIVVLGSFLLHGSIDQWKLALNKVALHPVREIHDILRKDFGWTR